MEINKILTNYLKNKAKNQPDMVAAAKSALKKSGFEKFEVFVDDNNKLVLLNLEKDVSPGVVIKNNAIVDFKNTNDYDAVTVDAYARYNILRRISDGEDLQTLVGFFKKKRTWVIHCVEGENGFEAHTHGMDSYRHPNFKLDKNIGVEEISYLLNSLCKSVQRGNAFRDGDRIENLYDNCDILLEKDPDGLFDVRIVERSAGKN